MHIPRPRPKTQIKPIPTRQEKQMNAVMVGVLLFIIGLMFWSLNGATVAIFWIGAFIVIFSGVVDD